MQVTSVKPNNVCYGQGKDYDNLVKDNCWKQIAGEVHAQGKEQAT
jgi:hypothetical protein